MVAKKNKDSSLPAAQAHPLLKRTLLAAAVASLPLSMASAPAYAACSLGSILECGAPGGAGQHPGRNMQGGSGDGTGGNATQFDAVLGTSEVAGATASNGQGGQGATASDTTDGTTILGGAGGLPGAVGSANLNASQTGNIGQDGADADPLSHRWGAGGGGGGAGVYINDANATQTIAGSTTVTGGKGGRGGALQDVTDSVNGDAGGGGGGGAGIIATVRTTLTNNGNVVGGAGGRGGDGGYSGSGGGGGDGILLLGAGSSITNNGSILGGAGGAAGTQTAIAAGTAPGVEGDGGAGVNIGSAGATLINNGTISGGSTSGMALPGAGVRAWGNATVTARGASLIQGGLNGGTRADAVLFSGGGNTLAIEPGAAFAGSIESQSGTTNGGDTLELAGSSNASFNAGQLIGFAQGVKSGANTWTLTGNGVSGMNWLVQDGGLIGDAASLRGDLVLDNSGGANPAVDFKQLAAGNYAGAISGQGSLTKDGAGILTLSGDLSGFAGTLTFGGSAAGVVVTGDGDMRNVEVSGVDASLDVSAITSLSARIAGISGGGNVALGTRTLVLQNPANDNFGGVITGSGGLTLIAGTQTLAGLNSYTGDTTIMNGATLKIDGAGTIALSRVVVGGTLDGTTVSPGPMGIKSLAGSGSVVLGSADLSISTGADTFSGVISGGGGISLDSGSQHLTGVNTYTGDTTVNGGTLFVDNNGSLGPATRLVLNSGALDVTSKTAGSGLGISSLAGGNTSHLRLGAIDLTISNAGDAFDGVIGGTGSVTLNGGKETLNGINTYIGATQVNSGATLIVGDSTHTSAAIAGNVNVNAGTLGGSGTIQGNATIAGNGTLMAGDAGTLGTLTVNGNLTIGTGTQLDFDFDAPGADFATPGQSDHIVATGNLAINSATLNVTDLGNMGPGLYNLFKWGGSLTWNSGFSPPPGMTLQVLTTDKQINLIDTQGLTLNVWDPNHLATAGGSLGGGSGTWTTDALAWTDTNASQHGPMSPQPAFAVFGGAPGQVKVDDSRGGVSVSGMQFMTDGYRVYGDAVDLVGSGGAAPVLRVSGGATATIDAVLTGTSGINKTDAGTLVLTAANLYQGDTTLSGGELSVSAEQNLGITANRLDFEGGTLQITGNSFHQTTRDIVWGSPGGGFDIADAANTFTVSQSLTGTGGLFKTGAGTLVLAGNNSYTGGTVVGQGVLQGDTASIQGNIANNATVVFAQQVDGTYAGAMSGTGALVKNGAGTLALTGVNSYRGGTTVNAGALQGNAASLQGNILNNATVIFAQQSDGAYAGAMSGAGTLIKNGAGTLALTGINTYSGGTTVNAGALQGDTSSLQGNIANNATVIFAQAADGTYAGAMSGTGALVKAGAGTLMFTGANSYSGGTTVTGGTLLGSAASLHGPIANDATLVFNQDSDAAFAGTLAGSGRTVKQGAGTLVLNGANSFTGIMQVAAGKLVVGDDTHGAASLGGPVTVDSAAVLGGIGSIGGLALAGTLSPGNSIGTLHVNGNATFLPGSAYQVEVSPDGTGDRLAATGSVSLQGGSAVALADNGEWRPQTQFDIITAGGGVNGRFDTVTSNLAFLTPTLNYGANAVTLTLARNEASFPSVALTRNQRAVAGAIEPLGNGNPLYQAIVGQDAATAREGFDRLSGEQFASTRSALIDDSHYVRDAIDRHLLGLSNGGAQATDGRGLTAWTSGWGHWGDYRGDGNASRMDSHGSGFLIGADMPVAPNARAGVVVGQRQNGLGVDSLGSSAHVSSTDVGLYGDVSLGRFALRAGVAYAWQKVSASRQASFGGFDNGLDDDYSARVAHGFIEGGYRLQLSERHELEPFINLARVQLHTDGTTESGGPAALSVSRETSDVNTATFGLRDTWTLGASGSTKLYASLGYQQAWGDVTPKSTMRFATGSNSFEVTGTPVARRAAVVDAGVSFAVARNVSLEASYMGRFGNDAKEQGGRLSLIMLW